MKNSPRYLSIDILKAVGIIYVIMLHQLIWIFFSGDGDVFRLKYQEGYPFFHFISYRSGLHLLGMQLPVLAGITYRLIILSGRIRWNQILKRALFLIFLGYAMNLLAWFSSEGFYWDDAFDWDILQFIAISSIVSYPFVKNLSKWFNVLILSALGLVTLYYSDQYVCSQYSGSYLYSIIMGDVLGENYWPFFPWYSLFVCGIFLGEALRIGNQRCLKIILFFGVLLLGLSIWSGHFLPFVKIENSWGPTLFKPSPYFIIGIIGFCFISVPGLTIFLSRYKTVKERLKKSVLIYFGQGILWIYIVTTILGYNLNQLIMKHMMLNFDQAFLVFLCILSFNLFISYLIGKWLCASKTVDYL